MSMITVAKKDFRDSIRSQVLIGLILLFVLFVAGIAYYYTEVAPVGTAREAPMMTAVLSSMLLPVYSLLPIVGTLVGYKALVSERESGSMKFLLGLPHTRQDVVVGKLLGRSGIVTIAVLAGFVVGGAVLYTLTSRFVFTDYAFFTLLTVLLGVTFVSIAIAFSSFTDSSSIATAGAIVLTLLFIFLWNGFLALIYNAAEYISLVEASATSSPVWYLFLQQLNPASSYTAVVNGLLYPDAEPFLQNAPFYLENWFGFVILLLWLFVPIGFAIIRFQRSEI